MARQDALSILDSSEAKDKLAEVGGKLIENIQKGALSSILKNTDYSGDPTSGSVEVNRFMNAQSKDYGTARSASEGDKVKNSKVTVNIDTDKEIVEEVANKDLRLFGITNIVDRRTKNHAKRAIAELDKAFFATAVTAAKDVTTSETDIEDVVEALIQKLETVENDYVDGVEREMMAITASPKAYGKLRKYIDRVDGGAGEASIGMFHGVEIHSNVRQSVDLLIQVKGAVAQPVAIDEYQAERIPQSNDFSIDLFYSYGTKAVTPDLIFKMKTLPVPTTPAPSTPKDEDEGEGEIVA